MKILRIIIESYGCLELGEELSIDFCGENNINNLKCYSIEPHYLKLFLGFITGRKTRYELKQEHNSNNSPFSFTITIEDKDIFSYNIEFSENCELLSECLTINGVIWGFLNCIDNTFEEGECFGRCIEDPELESDLLISSISNHGKGNNIFFPVAFKRFEKLINQIVIIDTYEFRRISDIKNNLNSLPADISKTTRNMIPSLGLGINKVTEDWKFCSTGDPDGTIPLEAHGSGLITLLQIIPLMVFSINYEVCAVILPISGSLHPKLEEHLLDHFITEANSINFKGQFIFTTVREDSINIITPKYKANTRII